MKSERLQMLANELVDGESDGLARGNAHHTRSDTFVEGTEAFFADELAADGDDARPPRHVGGGAVLLKTGLDGVERGIREGSDRAGHEPDQRGFPRGQRVGTMVALQILFGLGINCEIGTLVGGLARRGQRHTTVQRRQTFLFDDHVRGLHGVPVVRSGHHVGSSGRSRSRRRRGGPHGPGELRNRRNEPQMLRLQPDLDHLHGIDHEYGLGDTRAHTCNKRVARGDNAGVFVCEQLAVELVRSEPDRHLGDDTDHHGPQALVERQQPFFSVDIAARAHEPRRLGALGRVPLVDLHAHFDGVERVAAQRLEQPGGAACHEINSRM